MSVSNSVSAPSFALLGLEPFRAVFEYARSHFASFDECPAGDGHPVVVFPGLGANELATGPLREFCRARGYAAYDWGGGLNTGPRGDLDEWLAPLAERIKALARAHGNKVSLIGWSLGGIYARELAKMVSPKVRQVITLGTPFVADPSSTNAAKLYELLNGQTPVIDVQLAQRLAKHPSVPTTSVYSRTDGVVAWQHCLIEPSRFAQNIEVNDCSHLGLVVHAKVLSIIADRLQHSSRNWKPYH